MKRAARARHTARCVPPGDGQGTAGREGDARALLAPGEHIPARQSPRQPRLRCPCGESPPPLEQQRPRSAPASPVPEREGKSPSGHLWRAKHLEQGQGRGLESVPPPQEPLRCRRFYLTMRLMPPAACLAWMKGNFIFCSTSKCRSARRAASGGI